MPPTALLLRRTIDAQGKSRAWINGSAATLAQLREAADHLVDIHGQHAWQSLTRAASVRGAARCLCAASMRRRWRRAGSSGSAAQDALAHARSAQADLDRERERLAWQIGEVDKLAPGDGEWDELDAEHQPPGASAGADRRRTGCARCRLRSRRKRRAPGRPRASTRCSTWRRSTPQLAGVIEVLQGAQAQLQDAAHTLASYLHRDRPRPAAPARSTSACRPG